MSLKRFAVVAVVAAAGISTSSATAKAHCNCIDTAAHELMRQVRKLEPAYVAHFQSARQFTHGLNDVRQVVALATHFHETAHRKGDAQHLRGDLEKLDRAVHHLEATVAEMERESHASARGGQNFPALMRKLRGTIHQLETMIVRGCGCNAASGAVTPSHAPHGGGWSGQPAVTPPRGNTSFRNGNFGFLFRW